MKTLLAAILLLVAHAATAQTLHKNTLAVFKTELNALSTAVGDSLGPAVALAQHEVTQIEDPHLTLEMLATLNHPVYLNSGLVSQMLALYVMLDMLSISGNAGEVYPVCMYLGIERGGLAEATPEPVLVRGTIIEAHRTGEHFRRRTLMLFDRIAQQLACR